MLRQKLWEEFERNLEFLKINILGATPIQMEGYHQARIYNRNHTKALERGRLDGNWLGTDFFALDMSLLIFLESSITDCDLTSELAKRKGASPYGWRLPEELRSISPISNRCFSLLHTWDCKEEVVQDIKEIINIDATSLFENADKGAKIHWTDLMNIRGYCNIDEEENPYDIIFRFIVRIVSILNVDILIQRDAYINDLYQSLLSFSSNGHLHSPEEVRNSFIGILGKINLMLKPLYKPSKLKGLLATSETELFLDDILSQRTMLYNLLPLLTNIKCYNVHTAKFVLRIMQRNHLFVNDWERHRFLTTIIFFTK
jgi:hypothetical protein